MLKQIVLLSIFYLFYIQNINSQTDTPYYVNRSNITSMQKLVAETILGALENERIDFAIKFFDSKLPSTDSVRLTRIYTLINNLCPGEKWGQGSLFLKFENEIKAYERIYIAPHPTKKQIIFSVKIIFSHNIANQLAIDFEGKEIKSNKRISTLFSNIGIALEPIQQRKASLIDWENGKIKYIPKTKYIVHRLRLDSLPDITLIPEIDSLELWGIRSKEEFPSEFLALKGLKKLRIIGQFEILPDEVASYSSLETLKITSPNLIELNPAIFELRSLKRLTFSSCPNLDSISQKIGMLTNLEHLVLSSSSGVNAIPPAIAKCKKLKTLSFPISSRPLEVPIQIEELSELTELSLPGCAPSCYIDVKKFPNLRVLRLRNQKNRTRTIQDITHLKHLQTLEFDVDYHSTLPKEFSDLTKLEKLKIHTSSQKLPEINHPISAVEHLEIESASSLMYLSKFPNLKSLKINRASKAIEDWGEITTLGKLESLSVKWCKIKDFPIELIQLENLREINMRYNELQYIPEEIKNMPNLEILEIGQKQMRACGIEYNDFPNIVIY